MKPRLSRRIVALLSCLLIFCSLSIAPIQADTSISTEEMNDFSNRTTESLLDEILNGSYDAYFIISSMPNTAYAYLKDNFEIFTEFESRDDATEVLSARLDQLSDDVDTGSQDDAWFIAALLSQPAYETGPELDDIILPQNNLVRTLAVTDDTFRVDYIINGLPYMIADEVGETLSYDPVTLLYTIYEHSDQAKTNTANAIYEQCGLSNPISGHDENYNCHSYAWYNRSFTNPYWIVDISPYLNDPHYYEVTTSTAQVGDVVVYENNDSGMAHSAIIYSISTGASMVPTITCESKMGAGGVYRHDIRNVPDLYMKDGAAVFKIYRYSDSHTCTGSYAQYNTTYHKRYCAYCTYWDTFVHVYTVTSYNTSTHTLTCRMCGQTKTEAHTPNAQTGKCTKCAYTGPISGNPILSLPPELQTENCDHCAVTE